ncbi:hypothetical protein KC337_g39 [Hortaea werneckii]|nr:hypothetical protein KC337_g39 [Hortaea werneckii]
MLLRWPRVRSLRVASTVSSSSGHIAISRVKVFGDLVESACLLIDLGKLSSRFFVRRQPVNRSVARVQYCAYMHISQLDVSFWLRLVLHDIDTDLVYGSTGLPQSRPLTIEANGVGRVFPEHFTRACFCRSNDFLSRGLFVHCFYHLMARFRLSPPSSTWNFAHLGLRHRLRDAMFASCAQASLLPQLALFAVSCVVFARSSAAPFPCELMLRGGLSDNNCVGIFTGTCNVIICISDISEFLLLVLIVLLSNPRGCFWCDSSCSLNLLASQACCVHFWIVSSKEKRPLIRARGVVCALQSELSVLSAFARLGAPPDGRTSLPVLFGRPASFEESAGAGELDDALRLRPVMGMRLKRSHGVVRMRCRRRHLEALLVCLAIAPETFWPFRDARQAVKQRFTVTVARCDVRKKLNTKAPDTYGGISSRRALLARVASLALKTRSRASEKGQKTYTSGLSQSTKQDR